MAVALILFVISTSANLSGIHAQQSVSCAELIMNGSFESAGLGWKRMVGASLFNYATNAFVSGQQSLLLGFTDTTTIPATFAVEQRVTLPPESTSIELIFHYDVRSEGQPSAGDQAILLIYDPLTNQPITVQVLPPSQTGTWAIGRYDLIALKGKEIGLAFATQNDGEPGRLAMYVDDVSIQACQPPADLPLPSLAVPNIVTSPVPNSVASPTPQLLPLLPQVTPTAPQAAPLLPQITPSSPQATPLFPQVGSIDSLAACSCTSSLYACTDFSNWSVAQACYTLCQVTAGYDIHGLDEDRNGIACELELQDVAPLTVTVTPPPSTSPDPASPITPTLIITDLNAVPPTVLPPAIPITIDPVGASPAVTSTTGVTATEPVTVATIPVTSSPVTSTVVTSTLVTSSLVTSNVVTDSADALVASPTVLVLDASAATGPPATDPTTLEMLSLLLFSPLGIFAAAALLTIGLLSLWVAYLVGLRRPPPDMNKG